MPSVVAQNLVLMKWKCLDGTDTPISGLSTVAGVDFAITLQRQSGSTFVAAAETVTITEVGATGHYVFAFTPQNTGYYTLDVHELNAGSMGRWPSETWDVLPAGAVFSPTFSNAYCAETDVERYAGLSFTATSKVTSSQAAAFAEERASGLTVRCASWGLTVTPSTVTAGSELEDMLRAANAIGAALDAVIAWFSQTDPARTEKAASLLEQWIYYCGDSSNPQKIKGLLEAYIASTTSLSSSHIISGDTTPRASENAPQDIGLQFKMGDLF